jgi:preprotein translocase subunit SecD
MNSQLKWKFVLIAGIILICVYGIFGLPEFPTSLGQVKSNIAQRIQLGLDLKGGSHLVLQVQVEEAIGQRCDETVDEITKQLHDKNVGFGEIRRVDDTHILVRDVDSNATGAFRDLVSSQFQDWTMNPAAGETNGYLLAMKPSVVADLNTNTMDQTLETITRRINALGLTEPTIAFTGRSDDEILVQLPGVGDPTAAKEVIRAGGQLQLVRVAEGPFPSEAAALAQHGGVLPAGTIIVPGKPDSAGGNPTSGQVFYILDRTPIVTGQDLRSAVASPSTNNPGSYQVDFKLSTSAAARFGPFTEAQAAIGGKMAVVLDHQVYEAATIQSRIEDSGQITGTFSQESAQDLALVLRAGALPASIKYLEERTVGPSLGADSIRDGVWASVGSLLVVMIFLVIYYRLSGVNAVVALILNLLILVAFMAYVGAVLTLPGIAGVILTIGMGVDSNVLVFERIREELRNGKLPAAAVATGFDRAFLTIIDTHVTTVVSAIFLLFGTGPVRGFAITLIVGLLANVFTSIYVSRAIFDFHLSRMDRQGHLSI